jgi:hypothetical protein
MYLQMLSRATFQADFVLADFSWQTWAPNDPKKGAVCVRNAAPAHSAHFGL